MKNKILTKIGALVVGLTMAVGVGIAVSNNARLEAKADDDLIYTLTPASGTNNSYAGNCDVTIDGITWNITGNSTLIPWRLGGKSLSGVDRAVYSKTAMESAISKIKLEVGAASSITVNSLKLNVASDDEFSNSLDEVTATFEANSTITFAPTSGDSWAVDAFYKFTFNVSVSGTSNKFVEFKSAEFYANSSVPAVNELKSIELSGNYQKDFNLNDAFNHDNMVVTAKYTVDADKDVTESATWTSPDMTSVGAKTVTVSYTEGEITKTADYTINVTDPDAVSDVLDNAFTGVTGTSYSAWTNTSSTSNVVYKGQSAGGNTSIQIRSDKSNSGVVSTTSCGKLASVAIEWNSSTASGRIVDIYASNTAYEDPTDLYDSAKQGTKVGSVAKSAGNGTVLVTGDYAYVGIRSNSGAMYISKITVSWTVEASETTLVKAGKYAKTFVETMTCDGASSVTADTAAWGQMKTAFLALDEDVQNLLKGHDAGNKDTEVPSGDVTETNAEAYVEAALIRYEWIIHVYGTATYENFMERTINVTGGTNIGSVMFNYAAKNNATLLIVIISVVAISALGAYLFIDKRRNTSK